MTMIQIASAVGQTAASRSHIASLLAKCWRAFQEHQERVQARAQLHAMSDRQLADIGLTRGGIDFAVAESARMRART